MNRIVFELCAEDRARLDAIIIGLQGLTAGAAATPAEPAAGHSPDASGAPEDLPAEAPDAPAVKPVSLAEFQRAITLRCAESAETKAAVRALVKQFAVSVSDIPEGKRAEFLAKLSEL